MKLFTIGDSISQGFMSLSAARTDNSYSTLIAKALGLKIYTDEYRFADWNDDGIPLNIEVIMRELQSRYGTDVGGFEWLTVAQTINRIVDRAEDYYERGAGRADAPYDQTGTQFFNNVAVWGFEVADAFQVSARVCKEAIYNKRKPTKDNLITLGADNAMYRTALKVLNPSLDPSFDDFTQLDWLRLHATGTDKQGKKVKDKNNKTVSGGGIENLILWLGANNALGTVLNLRINQTPNLRNADKRPHEYEHLIRAQFGWNLWHPEDFRADYEKMLNRVDEIMQKNLDPNWKVFVGTVPLVTIAPITKGIGETTEVSISKIIDGKEVNSSAIYYKYYTYFAFDEKIAHDTGKYITMQDALHIDNCIREYNRIIRETVKKLNISNKKERYHIVDICQMLEDIAYKRNNGQPPYEMPADLKFIYPPVNTKYYHAGKDGSLKQGGLFSLDGVHPTAIGHGLLAHEFLKVMENAGVTTQTGDAVSPQNLDWFGTKNLPGNINFKYEKGIVPSDLLYTQPLRNMQQIYDKAEIAGRILEFIQRFAAK